MIELTDGQIPYNVRSSEGEVVTSGVIDIIVLQLACEECEAKHKLPTDSDGRLRATAGFLRDLAAELGTLGITGCTPGMAAQLWMAASEQVTALKKNTGETQSSPFGTESIPSPDQSPANKPPDCGCH